MEVGINKIKLILMLILVGSFSFAATPRYQDNEFLRKDKSILTLWPSIPFFEGGDLGQYRETMKQDRDTVRKMFMGELLDALERLADKGGAVDLMLEPMANILMMFDQVHDIHKAKDVVGIDKSLEAQFKASFENLFRLYDIRDNHRKIQFSTGTEKNLLEAYIRQISVEQPFGVPISADELKVQMALEIYEQIDLVAYGTFSNLGRGDFQLTFHISNNKNGTQRSFISRGPLIKALDDLVKQVFDFFQKNVYPDWETPFKGLAWLPIPINYNKKDGYTWEETNFYCKNRGYRLPFARELLMAESGGAYKEGGIEALDLKTSYPVADRRLSMDHYVFTPGNEAASGGPIQAASYTMSKGRFWCAKGAVAPEVRIFEQVWELLRKHSRNRTLFRALHTIRYELGDFGADQPLFFDSGKGVERVERMDSLEEAQGVLKGHGISLKIPEVYSPTILDWVVTHTWSPVVTKGFNLFPLNQNYFLNFKGDQPFNMDTSQTVDESGPSETSEPSDPSEPSDDQESPSHPSEDRNRKDKRDHPQRGNKGGGSDQDDLYDRGRRAAAGEMGRLIGREAWEQMKEKEQHHILDTYRETLRGKLLLRYGLDRATMGPKTYGYMISRREGRDASHRYCRELEVDIVRDLVRHYGRSYSCQWDSGEWLPQSSTQIRWDEGPRSNPAPGNPNPGDWLPPKH